MTLDSGNIVFMRIFAVVLETYVNYMFGALNPGFRSLATLKRVVNVVGEL